MVTPTRPPPCSATATTLRCGTKPTRCGRAARISAGVRSRVTASAAEVGEVMGSDRDGPERLAPGPAADLWIGGPGPAIDRKITRLSSSHANISYAVFCL